MNPPDKYTSELARQNVFRICTSWRPALLAYGYSEALVDEWITKAQDELVGMKAHTYVSVSRLWGRLLQPEAHSRSSTVSGELGFEAGVPPRS